MSIDDGFPTGESCFGKLIMDSSGNLYGTTVSGRASYYRNVFELLNSGASYSEKVLYSSTNSGGLSQ